ncbi:MAG: ATP-binding protein [Rhodocyclaceae bacterium]|nr:ATP-binding protein [Rhodocyclaceae bacterium]MCB1900355.1 ATP-binding protein [Rhodocyclaceae bacterium]
MGGRNRHQSNAAIVELVANCLDAYATEVKISWPEPRTP